MFHVLITLITARWYHNFGIWKFYCINCAYFFHAAFSLNRLLNSTWFATVTSNIVSAFAVVNALTGKVSATLGCLVFSYYSPSRLLTIVLQCVSSHPDHEYKSLFFPFFDAFYNSKPGSVSLFWTQVVGHAEGAGSAITFECCRRVPENLGCSNCELAPSTDP